MIFRDWFNLDKTLSIGDWPYLFLENIREFSWWPQSPFLWLEPYYQITAKIGLEIFHFSWPLIERLFWFWPFLFLIIFCSYRLTRSWLGVLIYATNTYILMIVGGGQMGVAMAYSLAPLALGLFINHSRVNELTSLQVKKFNSLINNSLIKNKVIPGFILGLQMMFDPRLALLTAAAAFFYCLFVSRPRPWRSFFSVGLVALLLNLFWLIPWLRFSQEASPTLIEVDFFSFASFSNTIALLHPNWPENIFGKLYFMKPEFLVLPILAFSSLILSINHSRVNELTSLQVKKFNSLINNSLINNKGILYFSLLGLIGAFLAKGTRPPFGEIYFSLFKYLPGFNLFRDPTKFYLLTALSYAILIPRLIGGRRGLKLIFVIFWLFTIRQAVLGQLGGTFQGTAVPQEYLALKAFLQQDDQSTPVFWFPQRQRFGFQSLDHPAVEGFVLSTEEELRELGVKYVIIPFDSEKEIFLDDHQYSEAKRQEFVAELNQLDFLEKLEPENFAKIDIYEYRSF